jgi:hypothetical protein
MLSVAELALENYNKDYLDIDFEVSSSFPLSDERTKRAELYKRIVISP